MALRLVTLSPFLVIIFSMWLLLCSSQAKEYVVGGTENSWKVPLSSPDSLYLWANTHRFRVGDSLIFKYDKRNESVHMVNETDYSYCITKGAQHVVFKNGNTKVSLTEPGSKYFISGTHANCKKGLRLTVFVMPEETNSLPPSPISTPSPSPLPSGVARSSGYGFIGCVMWLGVSMVMMWLM